MSFDLVESPRLADPITGSLRSLALPSQFSLRKGRRADKGAEIADSEPGQPRSSQQLAGATTGKPGDAHNPISPIGSTGSLPPRSTVPDEESPGANDRKTCFFCPSQRSKPSPLWWARFRKTVTGRGFSRVLTPETAGLCPARPLSVQRRWRRTIGEKVEGATPFLPFKVRHRTGMTIAHQIAHFFIPFSGVSPSTVIPAGRLSSRPGSRQRKSSRPQMALWPREASLVDVPTR